MATKKTKRLSPTKEALELAAREGRISELRAQEKQARERQVEWLRGSIDTALSKVSREALLEIAEHLGISATPDASFRSLAEIRRDDALRELAELERDAAALRESIARGAR